MNFQVVYTLAISIVTSFMIQETHGSPISINILQETDKETPGSPISINIIQRALKGCCERPNSGCCATANGNETIHTEELSTTTKEPTTAAKEPTTKEPTSKEPTTTNVTPECTTGMISIGSEFFKVFPDKRYNWMEAEKMCTNEGLTMAEPQEALSAVAQYAYENFSWKFWLGARANGSMYVWNSGNVVSSTSPNWHYNWINHVAPGGDRVTTDYCLSTFNRPYPYGPNLCSHSFYAICQCTLVTY